MSYSSLLRVIVIQVKKPSSNKTSLELTYESLQKIHGLYEHLDETTKLIAEARGIPKYEAAFLVEEKDEGGVLDRASEAIEALQEAGEKLKQELKEYSDSLPEFFENTKATLDVVSREADTIIPKSGIFSKIGTGLSSVTRALFGVEKGPVNKITQMSNDFNMLKSMIDRGAKVIVLGVQKDQKNALKDPEIKKEFDARKDELMGTPFSEMKEEDIAKFELPSPDEIKKLLGASLKTPEGMFAGFKKLAKSLKIGLGDMPFKKYFKIDELVEDFTNCTPKEIKSIFDKNPTAAPRPSPALQQVGNVLQDTQEIKNDVPEQALKQHTVKDLEEFSNSFKSSKGGFKDPKAAAEVIKKVLGKDKFKESMWLIGPLLYEAEASQGGEVPSGDYDALKLYKALAEKELLPKKGKIAFFKELTDAIEKKFAMKAKGDIEKELKRTGGKKETKGLLKSEPDIEKAGEKKAPVLAKEKLKPGEYAKYASGHVAVTKKGEDVIATIYPDRKYKETEGGSEEAAKKKALTTEALLFDRWSRLAGIT